MKPSKLPMAGTCRCGQVKIEISAPPLMTAACHCTGCQRMSGSAFSLTAIIPAGGFRVTEGEPVIGGLRGPELDHYFCPACMSWMFTRVKAYDAFVNVRPTMLDDPSWFSPFIETMTKEKLAWAQTPALHKFEGFPPMEDFGKLIDEFSTA
jgi:hypothetical protein